MNDGGIDTSFVHQDDGLLGGEVRHLTMREVAWQSGSPEVNLGVDDLHRILRDHAPATDHFHGNMELACAIEAQAVAFMSIIQLNAKRSGFCGSYFTCTGTFWSTEANSVCSGSLNGNETSRDGPGVGSRSTPTWVISSGLRKSIRPEEDPPPS